LAQVLQFSDMLNKNASANIKTG